MDWHADCAAVIPCLNEEKSISLIVAGAFRHVRRVIVVDDQSTDKTATVAQAAGAEVIRQPVNLGKGAALRTGWQRAGDYGVPWVITLDGDGQHAPEDMPRFFSCADRTSASLVIGNRMDNPKGMPRLRRVVNRWMSRRLSKMAGTSFPDSQCGFRLLNLKVLRSLQLTTAHFEIESEVLLSFLRAGEHIEFVPIQVLYKGEQSKIHPWRDTVRWFKWWRRQHLQ